MNKGGRPRKTKGLINVAKWLPQMRRVCSRQIVLNQLDALERDHTLSEGRVRIKARIAQIKKDVANIQS
jgi:hypothetical protein